MCIIMGLVLFLLSVVICSLIIGRKKIKRRIGFISKEEAALGPCRDGGNHKWFEQSSIGTFTWSIAIANVYDMPMSVMHAFKTFQSMTAKKAPLIITACGACGLERNDIKNQYMEFKKELFDFHSLDYEPSTKTIIFDAHHGQTISIDS